ncbi:MAG: T9SS type A sorting domain-containing protein [Bacteroidetes bacterium]|nr:T9SS type A sorting domain-containing protein [Bacteroidota bacterium]
MKLLIYLIITISFSILTFAHLSKESERSIILWTPSQAYLNLNNISTVFGNNGISDTDIEGMNAGFEFPKGSGKTAIFASGFLWGALIPGDPQVRCGGSAYSSGLQPGKLIAPNVAEDPTAEHVRIYRVRPDVYPGGPPVDLSSEAIIEGKSEAELRAQYERDWNEWRAEDGAPYDDVDGNGTYYPNIDIPGIQSAVQTIWFVANDLDPLFTRDFIGSDPLGVEMQATIWEYQDGGFLDNVIFKSYKLINKSIFPFEDMYISMWSDPDVGDFEDDFVGCDTLLNLGYAYNAYDFDAVYNPLPTPAVGFKLLQGPSDSTGFNLPMTAFFYITERSMFERGSGQFDGRATQLYNFMTGRIGITGQLFTDPITGQSTTYANSGDPLTGEGWIDGILQGPGQRKMGLSSGPFNMAIGDTQEIVIAEIAALGTDNLDSFKKLKYYSIQIQNFYDGGYQQNLDPKPPNPVVSIKRTDPQIILDWSQDNSQLDLIEGFNQSGYKFQGYNLYQLPSSLPFMENALRIATFDIIDGINELPGSIMDPETGLPVVGIQQYGSDSGIERMIILDRDYIEDSQLIVGKKYYYAVTAYTYNPDPEVFTNNTESLINLTEVIYYDGLPGAGYADTVLVKRNEGIANAKILVTIEDPTKITGDDYELFFTKRAEIRNENGDWVSASNVLRKSDPNDPDTLTGTTIDITAIYGPSSTTTELHFYLDVVHHYYGWVDGVILTFPANVTIIDSPPFRASGGTVEPEIIGQNIHYGVTDNSATGNGIFHTGGEEWIVIVATITPPLSVYWIAFDDGSSGGGPPETGTTVLTEVGFESRVAQYWNIFDLTIEMMALENQSIVNNYYMYPPCDDFPEYFGPVEAPIVDGFQINVDISYDDPVTISSLTLNGNPLSSDLNPPYGIQDYTVFGIVPATAANSSLGVGTDQLELLQIDYELRFTGIREIINIDGSNIEITAEGGGSIATLYGTRDYDIADHPLNPDSGSSEPFSVRIPFEVWSIDEQRQVNIMIYDRLGNPMDDDPFRVWNTEDRMYTAFVLTNYQETAYPLDDPDLANYATWNLVWWVNQYEIGDVVRVFYNNPVIAGSDTYVFTTPDPVDTVREFIPNDYLLFQNYPNPFNPITTIRFDLPEQGLVKLEVYDILGQRVAQLINTEMQVGRHEIDFNGNIFASGVYIYVLNVRDKFFEAKKMILLK